MVVITYDEPDVQQAFIDKFHITIPVLSDTNALSFKTLGILNENYTPGDLAMVFRIPASSSSIVTGGLSASCFSRTTVRAWTQLQRWHSPEPHWA